MENNSFFKKYVLAPMAILSVSLFITACDKDESDEDDNGHNQNKTYTISGNASGSQEVPAVTTSATGTITGTYTSSNNTLTYTINWSGLSGVVTAAHFHGPASKGVSAGVLVPITVSNPAATSSVTGSVVLADSVENALLDEKVYYNIHTAANPTGEIRGQIDVDDD